MAVPTETYSAAQLRALKRDEPFTEPECAMHNTLKRMVNGYRSYHRPTYKHRNTQIPHTGFDLLRRKVRAER